MAAAEETERALHEVPDTPDASERSIERITVIARSFARTTELKEMLETSGCSVTGLVTSDTPKGGWVAFANRVATPTETHVRPDAVLIGFSRRREDVRALTNAFQGLGVLAVAYGPRPIGWYRDRVIRWIREPQSAAGILNILNNWFRYSMSELEPTNTAE